MKPISIYVPERAYQEIKSIAARKGRPVAELMREAMAEYLERERTSQRSILDLPPHSSGALKKAWTRSDLLDEKLAR
jgi:hypothetical protein